jgi:hypothetical protein
VPPPYVRYRLERFLDPSSEKDTEDGVQTLLSGFFRELGNSSVLFHRSPGSMTTKDAISALSRRLVSMPVIVDGGTGIGFQMETAGNSRWSLILHRDVFFRVELRAFVGDSRRLSRRKGKRYVTTGTAHLFKNLWGVCGSPADIYLSRKLHELCTRHVHPLVPDGGLAAGAQFRQICRQAWENANPDDIAPRFLSIWGWRLGRFVRNYDNLIVRSVGPEQLESALSGMGVALNSWIPRL